LSSGNQKRKKERKGEKQMSILAQGTKVYFIDPDTDAVTQVQCAISFNPGGAPADQLDDTCLEDFDRSSKPGLRSPGQASLGLNADPQYASHIRLHDLSNDDPSPTLKWAIGWSDGTEDPTADTAGEFVLPTTRTWLTFEGYVSDFPFDFQLNSLVVTNVTIQRSGSSAWVKKT
jgi:hypothetical protein